MSLIAARWSQSMPWRKPNANAVTTRPTRSTVRSYYNLVALGPRLTEVRRNLFAEPLKRRRGPLGWAQVERGDDELVDAGVAVLPDHVLHLGRRADDGRERRDAALAFLQPRDVVAQVDERL